MRTEIPSSTDWILSIKNSVAEKKPKAAIFTYIRIRGGGITVIAAIPLVLKACASLSMLTLGKVLHSEILKSGAERDVVMGTSLVSMYGKCKDIQSARKVFDEMPERSAVSWNAMIGGYMKNGDTEAASRLFGTMKEWTSVTWTEMIDGYARNGDMAMARRVFDNMPKNLDSVVTWTVMVDMYARNGDMEAAREMFEMMGVKNFYVWSIMISGYFKIGDVVNARAVFDGMSVRNLVNWNSLISGYAQHGMFEDVMDAFTRMQEGGFEPDQVTLVSVLSACAQKGMLDVGKEIHEGILNNKIEFNEFVVNALVDMYSKCGDLESARLIFEGAFVKSTASWNSLITGFAIHGQSREAIELFRKMEESYVKPDEITFCSVLFACVHGGLVEEGLEFFSKIKKYGVKQTIKHYGCLVDLLGRVGRLEDAFNVVKAMPMEPNDKVLGSLLGACRTHSDSFMTENVLKFIGEISNGDAHYLLLSSIYAASKRWEMAERMRVAFKAKGYEKQTGCSVLMT